MTDERAQLRADLEAGRWQRLTDPLLPLVLLEDASWWRDARGTCLVQLIASYWAEAPARLQMEHHPPRVDVLTGLARRLVRRAGEPRSEVLSAIEVCERWP